MKKVMFAAALAAAMTGLADVQSANIVGYQQIKIAKGAYQLFTPTFKDVGAETYDIQNVVPYYENGEKVTSTSLQLQTCSAAGKYDKALVWRITVNGGKWCDGPKEKTGVDVGKGDAVCVYNNTGADVYLRVSGEVEFSPWSKTIATGSYQLIGNMLPVTIDIQDFKPYIGDVRVSTANIQLQTCTAAGKYNKALVWRPTVNGGSWCDGPKAVTQEILPGQAAVFLNSTGSNVRIAIEKDFE